MIPAIKGSLVISMYCMDNRLHVLQDINGLEIYIKYRSALC